MKTETQGTRQRILDSLKKIDQYHKKLQDYYELLAQPGHHERNDYTEGRCAIIGVKNELEYLLRTANTQQILESEKPAIDLLVQDVWTAFLAPENTL